MKNYTLVILLLVLLLMLSSYLADRFLMENICLGFGYWVILLFAIVTLAFHCFMMKMLKKQPQRFPLWYQLVAMIKIFIYFAVALGYVFFNKEEAKIFLVFYALCYLAFLLVDTTIMQKKVRAYQRQGGK